MNDHANSALDALASEGMLATPAADALSQELEQRKSLENVYARIANGDVLPEFRRRAPGSAILLTTCLAALIASAILVGSAFGVSVPVFDFFGGDEAPPKIVENFATLTVGAPAGMDPRALADETRRVETISLSDGRQHTLWVAPTTGGGFCYLWTGLAGGCDRIGTVPLSVSGTHAPSNASSSDIPATPQLDTPLVQIEGYVHSAYAAYVEIKFADGATARPKITWVSDPILAGFFAYQVPAEHQESGHEAVSAIAVNDSDEIVASQSLVQRAPDISKVPPEAIESEKQIVTRTSSAEGSATIWEAPTRYEGTCPWLEVGSVVRQFGACLPKGYRPEGLSLSFYPTTNAVFLLGTAGEDVGSLVVRYEDGAVSRVMPHTGYLLLAIPQEHYSPGRRVSHVEAFDRAGKEIPWGQLGPQQLQARGCYGVVPIPKDLGCR